MTDMNSYLFNNMGHLSADVSDQSQKNIYNTKFANYTLSNFFNDRASSQYVDFATSYPTMMVNGTNGGVVTNTTQTFVGKKTIDINIFRIVAQY